MVAIEALAWGKYRESSGQTHRLEHHCADVAACFEALLKDPVLRNRFDKAVGGSGLECTALARLTVLTFLHDFGKVNAGFQFAAGNDRPGTPRRVNHIKAAVWACRRPDVIDALGFPELASSWGPSAFEELLCATLAHHGRPAPLTNASGKGPPDIWRPFEGYDPLAACRRLNQLSREWFPKAFVQGPALLMSPALSHLFAGTVALADQIGSNEDLFPFESQPHSCYMDRARLLAHDAVRKLGFARARWPSRAPAANFQTLFEHPSPRPLQTAVAEAPLDCPLLILESETGSGKTEAAVWRFSKLWRAGLVDGLYLALPTRAAAQQLHQRVERALRHVFPAEAQFGTVLAIPGYLKVGEATGWRVGKYDIQWRDNPEDAGHLARWSAESARKFLSATAAVGTVDQALLSGLMVKWAHFRGAALARSLLVVDEVHASDAYMAEVLRSVLHSHLELGGHALLMSATLGSEARDAFATAGTRRRRRTELAAAKRVAYPVLTLSDLGAKHDFRVFEATGYSRNVVMCTMPILQEPARIAEVAVEYASQGAKVLVVRNTVREAQATFSKAQNRGPTSLLLQCEGGPALHHSRFAAEDRSRLDQAVENALGKGRAPGGQVVIGTQTLEQSLDIDADLLLTDLCPIDVLLQRIGRLHRHESTTRPDGFGEPRCLVLVPEGGLESGGLLRYGLGMSKKGGIYRDLRVLELTQRLVARHAVWTIPRMNRMLVEEGTHPDRLRALEEELGRAWMDRSMESDGRAAAERQLARRHSLNRGKSFQEVVFPDLDEHVRTRLGEDGPRIKLPEPVRGPFGQPVATFNIPAHMFRGADGMPAVEEIEEAWAQPMPGGLILHVGLRPFRYDRTGICERA